MPSLTPTQRAVLARCLEKRPVLLAFSQMILGDVHRAEDVFQEVVAKALEKSDQLDDPSQTDAWLMKICRNLATDLYRKERRSPLRFQSDVLDLLEQSLPNHLDAEAWEGRLAVLRKCLEELAPKAKRLLELRYQQNKSAEEIAVQVGLAKDSVYVTLARVRTSLKGCIGRRLATPS